MISSNCFADSNPISMQQKNIDQVDSNHQDQDSDLNSNSNSNQEADLLNQDQNNEDHEHVILLSEEKSISTEAGLNETEIPGEMRSNKVVDQTDVELETISSDKLDQSASSLLLIANKRRKQEKPRKQSNGGAMSDSDEPLPINSIQFQNNNSPANERQSKNALETFVATSSSCK